MGSDLAGLVERLSENPLVIGIVNYGGRHVRDEHVGGDFDIAVFVKQRPAQLEGIRFFWDGMPIDMNVRTFADLDRGSLDFIDPALSAGEILLDRTGELTRRLEQFTELWLSRRRWNNEHAVNMRRYEHTHILYKVRGRLDASPVLCEHLLATNMRGLLSAYYSVRNKPFPGARAAFESLKAEDPEFWTMLERFYGTPELINKLRIAEALTEYVLSPNGGLWREDEVLGSGTTAAAEDLNGQAQAMLSTLLGAQRGSLPRAQRP